jgi:hypothetical protein
VQIRWLELAVLATGVVGCGTDAVGVSDCRAIERARCDAAVACGFPTVDECRRLQRDQCLHGVAPEAVTAAQVDACVRDIEAAGSCAAALGPGTAAAACMSPVSTVAPARTACDVVLSPELAVSCVFLLPSAEQPPPPRPALDGGA